MKTFSIVIALMLVLPNDLHAQAPQSFDQCAKNPSFIIMVGMQQPVAIDTQQSLFPGMVVRELQGPRRTYRHPTWKKSGHVGSTVRDHDGNIYAVPIPSIDLETNPLEKRTSVYIVNTESGEMTVFKQLPKPGEDSQRNPFGTMGLTYDCSNQSLYVSSVANSGPLQIKGVIYQLDIHSGNILSSLEGVDALGLGIFDTGSGKRLYYGDARSSSVFSVPMGKKGEISKEAEPRHEFSLLSLKNGNSTQVRKIKFEPHHEHGYLLTATDTEFSFRLLTDTSRRFRHYQFRWDPQNRQWVFLKIK